MKNSILVCCLFCLLYGAVFARNPLTISLANNQPFEGYANRDENNVFGTPYQDYFQMPNAFVPEALLDEGYLRPEAQLAYINKGAIDAYIDIPFTLISTWRKPTYRQKWFLGAEGSDTSSRTNTLHVYINGNWIGTINQFANGEQGVYVVKCPILYLKFTSYTWINGKAHKNPIIPWNELRVLMDFGNSKPNFLLPTSQPLQPGCAVLTQSWTLKNVNSQIKQLYDSGNFYQELFRSCGDGLGFTSPGLGTCWRLTPGNFTPTSAACQGMSEPPKEIVNPISTKLTVGGIRARIAPVIVFLHGWDGASGLGGTWGNGYAQKLALDAGVVVDFGTSLGLNSTRVEAAQRVYPTLEHLKREFYDLFDLVGHSFGGQVAIEIVANGLGYQYGIETVVPVNSPQLGSPGADLMVALYQQSALLDSASGLAWLSTVGALWKSWFGNHNWKTINCLTTWNAPAWFSSAMKDWPTSNSHSRPIAYAPLVSDWWGENYQREPTEDEIADSKLIPFGKYGTWITYIFLYRYKAVHTEQRISPVTQSVNTYAAPITNNYSQKWSDLVVPAYSQLPQAQMRASIPTWSNRLVGIDHSSCHTLDGFAPYALQRNLGEHYAVLWRHLTVRKTF